MHLDKLTLFWESFASGDCMKSELYEKAADLSCCWLVGLLWINFFHRKFIVSCRFPLHCSVFIVHLHCKAPSFQFCCIRLIMSTQFVLMYFIHLLLFPVTSLATQWYWRDTSLFLIQIDISFIFQLNVLEKLWPLSNRFKMQNVINGINSIPFICFTDEENNFWVNCPDKEGSVY